MSSRCYEAITLDRIKAAANKLYPAALKTEVHQRSKGEPVWLFVTLPDTSWRKQPYFRARTMTSLCEILEEQVEPTDAQ